MPNKTFSDEVKDHVVTFQHGYCANCVSKIHSIHHKLPNTKANNNNYPLFVHSIFNAVGLCNPCHANYSHHYKITPYAAHYYEQYLERLRA